MNIENQQRRYAIGHRIQQIRRRRELLQADLAHQSGISQTLLSRIESGTTQITVDVLVALCRAVGCSSDEVLGLAPISPAAEERQEQQQTREVVA